MKSFFARLACCGLGLSLNTRIGVAAEWEPVNTDAESKSTTSNQVDSGRSTQWSPVQSKSGKSTKTNRQAVWTPVEPLKKSAPSQPTWAGIDTGTNVKDPIRWKPIEPAIAQQIEENINNEQPIVPIHIYGFRRPYLVIVLSDIYPAIGGHKTETIPPAAIT